MNGNTALVLAVVAKCLVSITAVATAGRLIAQGREGWGWVLFIAYVFAPGSLKFD